MSPDNAHAPTVLIAWWPVYSSLILNRALPFPRCTLESQIANF